MIPLLLRSRECLIENIKSLESDLSDLQERFNLIVNWICSQYHDFAGLPEPIVTAVLGNEAFSSQTEAKEISRNEFSLVKTEPEEENPPCDNLMILSTNDETEEEPDQCVVKSEDLLSADIEESSTSVHSLEGPLQMKKMKRVRKTGKYFQMNLENKLIIDAYEYKQMIASLPSERLTCVVCHKVFIDQKKLRRHEIEVHLTKEQKNLLRKGTQVTKVQKPQEKVENVPSVCEICDKSFKDVKSLNTHKTIHLPSAVITTVEGSKRSHYRCLNCDSLYTDKRKYTSHILHHCKLRKQQEKEKVPKPKGVFKCETCGLVTPSNSALNQHIVIHGDQRDFLCNQCGQGFRRSHTLRMHELAIHEKVRQYKCQYCEKTFVFKHVKNSHEKKHLGVLQVTCDLCGFKFTCKRTLQRHILGVHENRRPYKCHLCDKKFKTSTALKYHLNTHSNPNGRKRGLNVEIDPIKAAAKRRSCPNGKLYRIPVLTSIQTVENASTITKSEEHSQS